MAHIHNSEECNIVCCDCKKVACFCLNNSIVSNMLDASKYWKCHRCGGRDFKAVRLNQLDVVIGIMESNDES